MLRHPLRGLLWRQWRRLQRQRLPLRVPLVWRRVLWLRMRRLPLGRLAPLWRPLERVLSLLRQHLLELPQL